MTDQQSLPAPDEQPTESTVTGRKLPLRDLLLWLCGVGFIVLAAAFVYLWQYPGVPAETAANTAAINASEQHLTNIDQRVARLEQRPVADLGKINARLDALDARIADQAQLASQVDTLSGRIQSLSGRDQTGLDLAKQQLDALTSRVAAIELSASSIDAVTKRLSRIARLQEASYALSSGRPIGDLPNSPAALARYAHTAPPTEEQLRLRFQHSERAAMAARQPDVADGPFIGRMLERAQGLITIRQGDDIVLGNSSAVILNQAQTALEAGDLAGAATAVEGLKGQPAQLMANWLSDAKALLSARSALAQMADQV